MSFRELRDFTEYMRVLGYPRLVSVDNFRRPNFGLVADILYWMVHRYDPSASLSDDITSEDLRVEFLTSVAQIMWSKSGVKLNTKRLYSADGKAVKELLKVANLLYAAHQANIGEGEKDSDGKTQDDSDLDPSYNQLHAKLPDVKATRKLASQITESGAKLFDLLNDERELSSERQKCLRFLDSISNNLDSSSEHKFVEKKIEDLLVEGKENVRLLEKQCQDLASDEKTLEAKIKKRQGELERNSKRLKSLQSVRPAFMDEYEKLEAELERQYEVYLEKFRNLDYLEHRLELFNNNLKKKEQESKQILKSIQMNVMEKKARDLRGEEDETLFDDEGDEESSDNQDQDNRHRDDDRVSYRGHNPSRGSDRGRRPTSKKKDLSEDESDISSESEDSNADDGSDVSDESDDLSDDLLIDDSESSSDGEGSPLGPDGSHSDVSDESDDNF